MAIPRAISAFPISQGTLPLLRESFQNGWGDMGGRAVRPASSPTAEQAERIVRAALPPATPEGRPSLTNYSMLLGSPLVSAVVQPPPVPGETLQSLVNKIVRCRNGTEVMGTAEALQLYRLVRSASFFDALQGVATVVERCKLVPSIWNALLINKAHDNSPELFALKWTIFQNIPSCDKDTATFNIVMEMVGYAENLELAEAVLREAVATGNFNAATFTVFKNLAQQKGRLDLVANASRLEINVLIDRIFAFCPGRRPLLVADSKRLCDQIRCLLFSEALVAIANVAPTYQGNRFIWGNLLRNQNHADQAELFELKRMVFERILLEPADQTDSFVFNTFLSLAGKQGLYILAGHVFDEAARRGTANQETYHMMVDLLFTKDGAEAQAFFSARKHMFHAFASVFRVRSTIFFNLYDFSHGSGVLLILEAIREAPTAIFNIGIDNDPGEGGKHSLFRNLKLRYVAPLLPDGWVMDPDRSNAGRFVLKRSLV